MTPDTTRTLLTSIILVVFTVTSPVAKANSTEGTLPYDLISLQRGTIPVVISAPHDGTSPIPGAERSESGTTVRDMHTSEVAKIVADVLAERLNGNPYYVMARFSRQFVDANRGPGLRPEEAYTGNVAKAHYDAYHRALRIAVDEVREKFGRGLLVDIHGQSARPGQIIRGTELGNTVTAMLNDHGLEALIGPNSIFGQLDSRGYTVEPPVQNPTDSPKDERLFVGGYIVRAYGSHNSDGIDAIQIEIGRDLRQANVRRKTAVDLAEAIAIYVEEYILKTAAAQQSATTSP